MVSTVYATNREDVNTAIYHRMNSIKGIVSSPSIERIIFENGEIELITSQNELRICSKTYLPNGNSAITYQITKNLIPGYNPQMALNKAKNDILQRVVKLETDSLQKIISKELSAHVRRNMLKIEKPSQELNSSLQEVKIGQERFKVAV